MDFRKLMAFGNSSFIVSVPKAWVEKNRLKKGDVLLVEQKPNELILSAKDVSERKKLNEVTVNPDGKSFDEFKTEVVSLYVNNYDIITVVNVTDSAAVKDIFRNLVGMEVVEETATKIVAKDLLDIQEVSLENVIRRIDIIIRSMLIDSVGLDFKNSESVLGRDKEVNRLSLLGFRTARAATDNPRLLKLFNTSYWNVMLSKNVIANLERFADQVKRLLRASKGLDKSLKEDALKLMKSVSENYSQVMKVYYEKDRQAAFKMETKVRLVLKECRKLIEKHPNVNAAVMTEYFEHSVGSMKGILRVIMEYEL